MLASRADVKKARATSGLGVVVVLGRPNKTVVFVLDGNAEQRIVLLSNQKVTRGVRLLCWRLRSILSGLRFDP